MIERPTREQFKFFSRITTRWGDVDRMGHINNAMYFTYDEQARVSYLDNARALAGLDHKSVNFILARACCDFVEQIHDPAVIDYGIRIVRIGRSSLTVQGASFVGDRCHSVTSTVVVWFDWDAQKTAPLPEVLKESIRNYERVAPEQAG